jgi:sugar phosphate isomerase/epimerase
VDEVELVLFESGGDENLPSPGEVREMVRLGQGLGITYNVHLPTDLYLGDPDGALRERSCLTALRFHERTIPLDPTVYVLHLEPREHPDLGAWLERSGRSLETLVERGMDPSRIALENLGYPPGRIQPLAEGMGMPYCLDVGHLLRYGHDLAATLGRFISRTAMIHLHGVEDGVDHLGLERLPEPAWATLREILAAYRGGVSIEVFSLTDLCSSLTRLAEIGR